MGCTRAVSRAKKHPPRGFRAPVAAILSHEFLYTRPIFVTSLCQSSSESWNMQRESIQRYLMPNFRVILTASLNDSGKFSTSIPDFKSGKLSFVSIIGTTPPQQWDRVM